MNSNSNSIYLNRTFSQMQGQEDVPVEAGAHPYIYRDPDGDLGISYQYFYQYPSDSITTDILFFRYGKNKSDTIEVLLIKRANEPFKDKWALVGGFLDLDESIHKCAERELEEETGLRNSNLIPLGVYDDIDRDPRGRVISHAFVCIKRDNNVKPQAGDDAKEAKFFLIDDLPHLAFDHEKILEDALYTLGTIL